MLEVLLDRVHVHGQYSVEIQISAIRKKQGVKRVLDELDMRSAYRKVGFVLIGYAAVGFLGFKGGCSPSCESVRRAWRASGVQIQVIVDEWVAHFCSAARWLVSCVGCTNTRWYLGLQRDRARTYTHERNTSSALAHDKHTLRPCLT